MSRGIKMLLLKTASPATPTMEAGGQFSVRRPSVEQLSLIAFLLLSFAAIGIGQESKTANYANEADKALRGGEYDLAIINYKKVLQIEPSYAAAWSNLGSAWFAKGNFAEATDSFLHAARLQPANHDYAFNSALALVREYRCGTAERYLRISLRSAHHRPTALYLRGLCAFVSKDWPGARDTLLQAEASGSRTAETYYLLSIAARKSNDPNQAKRAFELLKSQFPDSSLLHELIGEASDQDDMSAEAEKELSLAIARSPDAPGLHAKLGFLLWKTHQLSDAQKLFEQELAIDPRSYSAMHYLGDVAEQTSQLPQALEWYERAMRERPTLGEAHFAIGRVLELEGRSAEALRELRASFPELESDASAHYWMARALKKLGMRQQANLELSKVQRINKAERDALMSKLNADQP
jgi:tetratricopeptide (TPR) repeat protein